MDLFIGWIFLSFIVAFIGSDRKIGYGSTLLLSLLLSPLIGAIFALASQRKQTTTVQSSKIPPQVFRNLNFAKREIKKRNFDKAIYFLKSALNIKPDTKMVLFNLSLCYSAKKDKDQSLFYLNRAIEQGYSSFNRIQEHPDFGFLRKQPEFIEFVKNGYKTPQLINDNNSLDRIGKLEKLAEMKEKGILTNEEFEKEKKILLSENKINVE